MTPIFFLNGTNCCVEGDNIMSKKYQPLLITHYMSTWVTITEAVEGNDSNLLIVFYVQIMPDD
ncbi:hypothetical protein ACS0TA_00005, partial [Escherichia coli]